MLGETLNLDLAVEDIEQWVGPFRADIIARTLDGEAEHRVVIENQFGKNNHTHLGQILTYLAGIENAKTVVWIAEKIQPDHRAAVDWLNKNTLEGFSFFAIEIELWCIENSPPAPRFNVVASPNDWTKAVRSASNRVGRPELAERHRARLAYWASFGAFLKERHSSFKINRSNKDHWFWFAIGRTNFGISATISVDKQRIGVELYASNDLNKAAFKALHTQKQEIEKELGFPLDWQELPSKKASRIAVYRQGVDPSDEKQYLELHTWMLSKMNLFKSAFGDRVRALPCDSTTDDKSRYEG